MNKRKHHRKSLLRCGRSMSRGWRHAVRRAAPRIPLCMPLWTIRETYFIYFFRFQIPDFHVHVHVFYTSPLFPFPNRSQLLFFRYNPFPFQISRFEIYVLRFTIYDRHTFIYSRASLNKRLVTADTPLCCKRSTRRGWRHAVRAAGPRIPLDRGDAWEIIDVGDAARCGPQARGEFPSFSTFQIFHFPNHSQQFETQSIYDFRFTIYVSWFLRFVFTIDTLYTLYRVSLNKRNRTKDILLRCAEINDVGDATRCGVQRPRSSLCIVGTLGRSTTWVTPRGAGRRPAENSPWFNVCMLYIFLFT